MFEEMTYETILTRALDRIEPELDKREGSILYTALAPACAELAQMYIVLDSMLEEVFAETASRDYLIRRALERGIQIKEATKAVAKGQFNKDVPLQSRFMLDGIYYTAMERISAGVFQLQCESSGSAPNAILGTLIPVNYIEGLESAQLTELLVPGEEEEETEAFRSRYFASIQNPSTSGNKHHYKQWALEVPGVGDAKVFPLWNGQGTVKVVIVNNEKQPATNEVVKQTLEHIEEQRPIGATVTVTSGMLKQITVTATVALSKDSSLQRTTQEFIRKLTEYFKEIAFEARYVSYAKIGTILLGTEGVIDYSELNINNRTSNIELTQEEVPVVGLVELEV